MQWSPLLINTVSSLEAALWHLSPRICKYLLCMQQDKPSLPTERRTCFLFLSFGLLQNCRVFSLFFFYFGGNNQRWWIWNNHFPVIFHLHSFFFPLTCSCDSMHRDPVGFWHIYLVRLLYFLMETLMQLKAEFSSTYKPRMKATCLSDFPAEWSQKVEILFTKHRIYYFANEFALINWRKRVKNEV